MRTLFSIQGPLYRVLDVIAQLMTLNLLFIIGALPLVTLGASAIALYDGVCAVKGDEFKVRRFFAVYRKHLVQGIVLGSAGLMSFIVLIALLWLVSHLGFAGQCLELFLLVVSALLLLSMPYVFVLPAAHDMSVMTTARSAISMCMTHMAASIAMASISLMAMAAAVVAWRLFFIWIFLAFAAVAWSHIEIMSKMPTGKRPRNAAVHP